MTVTTKWVERRDKKARWIPKRKTAATTENNCKTLIIHNYRKITKLNKKPQLKDDR